MKNGGVIRVNDITGIRSIIMVVLDVVTMLALVDMLEGLLGIIDNTLKSHITNLYNKRYSILLGVILSLNSFDHGTDSSISGFISHLGTRIIIRRQSRVN
jgi:hypothetical protein